MKTRRTSIFLRTSDGGRGQRKRLAKNSSTISVIYSSIQRRSVTRISSHSDMGPCNRTKARSSYNSAREDLPSFTNRVERVREIRPRTHEERNHSTVEEPLCSVLLLYQKERRKTPASTGLSTHQCLDHQKSISFASHSPID